MTDSRSATARDVNVRHGAAQVQPLSGTINA